MVQKYFMGSIFTLVVGLMLAFFIGGLPALWITLVLGILEVSLSFDNAVVNAKVLANMEEVWRKRFVTWGMLIAVFGMRLIFPLLIVSITMWIDPVSSLMLAINEPTQYQHILESVHISVMGFGGTFLGMVALKFFIDYEKDVHWVTPIENKLTVLGKIEAIQAAIMLGIVYITSVFIAEHSIEESHSFVIASMFGLILYILVDGIEAFIGVDEGVVTGVVVKSGIASFIYLEVLDASFSFDGVLAALALTNNIFIIALGLGIGAMAVRSLTLMLVDKGTVEQYTYLEHGAFAAIMALSLIMFVNTVYEIPETITGLIGVVLLGLSVVSSIKRK
ncbi:MAG: DUF475 domain-containing protein [Bacteroidales bacterium]|jgi:hypothetical protein